MPVSAPAGSGGSSDASGLTTGTVATARLGSGSASSSTYLRGDQTWATPSGSGDALVANPLSQFAATTSLQLKGVLSDETGSGALVFATSPALVTPLLGTPTSGVMTNVTGLPEAGLTLTDVTTANATTSAHGFLKKLSNTATEFMNGAGNWAVPAGGVDSLGITVDGAGSVIATGLKGFITVPVACTINSVTLLSTDDAVTSGSIVFDIWKDTYANYPPTIADTIVASAKPTISSAIKSTDATLTGWTTSVSAGDILAFNVDSVTALRRVTLVLKVTK